MELCIRFTECVEECCESKAQQSIGVHAHLDKSSPGRFTSQDLAQGKRLGWGDSSITGVAQEHVLVEVLKVGSRKCASKVGKRNKIERRMDRCRREESQCVAGRSCTPHLVVHAKPLLAVFVDHVRDRHGRHDLGERGDETAVETDHALGAIRLVYCIPEARVRRRMRRCSCRLESSSDQAE